MKSKLSILVLAGMLGLWSCADDPDPACECSIPWIPSGELRYEEGESVKHNGSCWVARSNFSADTEMPDMAGSAYWEACEESEVFACDCPNEWSIMSSYPAGAVVFYKQNCYIALTGNSSAAPDAIAGVWLQCQ